MKKNDLIQTMSIRGLKYARILTDNINPKEAEEIKKNYDAAHIYSYSKSSLEVLGYSCFQQKTPIISLEESLEKICASFRRDTKAGIKKSLSTPRLKMVVPDSSAAKSYEFYQKIKKADGVLPDIEIEFENCLFFNAYLNDILAVSTSFYGNGEVLRSKHIVSFRKESKENAKIASMATRALVRAICSYAKALGYKKLDLGGISLDDSKKAGILDFKMSFGGTVHDVNIYRTENEEFSKLRKKIKSEGQNIN